MVFTGLASNTGVAASQSIESKNSADLAGQNVTISLTAKSTSLTSLTLELYYANTTDTFGTWTSPTVTSIGTQAVTISTTESTVSWTIAVPSAAYTGLQLRITGGALVASQTLTIGQVQLEAGSTATSFDYRPYGTELALCQRYYETNYFGVATGTNAYGGYLIGTVSSNTVPVNQPYGAICFNTTKRASPTVTLYGYQGGSGKVSNYNAVDLAASSGSVNNSSISGFNPINNSGGTLTTTNLTILYNWTASIEL
jgi:hypothetical protein